MKKVVSITLLLSIGYTIRGETSRLPRALQTPLIELDGTFNIRPVSEILDYIRSVLHYNFNTHGDTPVYLQHLAEQDSTQRDPKKVQQFLHGCIRSFIQSLHAGNHIKSLLSIKGIVNKLADAWSKEHNKEASIFFKFCKEWKKPGTEVEYLNATIITLKDYHEFLLDFESFLVDILHSFPKSCEKL